MTRFIECPSLHEHVIARDEHCVRWQEDRRHHQPNERRH